RRQRRTFNLHGCAHGSALEAVALVHDGSGVGVAIGLCGNRLCLSCARNISRPLVGSAGGTLAKGGEGSRFAGILLVGTRSHLDRRLHGYRRILGIAFSIEYKSSRRGVDAWGCNTHFPPRIGSGCVTGPFDEIASAA